MKRSTRRQIRRYKTKVKRLFIRSPKVKFEYAWHYKHSKVKPNRMLFESFHGKNISDSPLYVLQELISSGKADNYEIFYATDNKKEHGKLARALGLPVKLVHIQSPKYAEVLATAKYLINNSSFPAYFIRRDEQVYVQTWHGTPLKTLGKRMRLGIESMYNVQHNFLQASYITYPNDFTRDVMMRDYNLERFYTGKVAMVGYPRNDVFTKHTSDTALRKRLRLDGTLNIAYMPTWRGTSNHDVAKESYQADVEAIFDRLDTVLGDDQHIYVNFHPMVADIFTSLDYKHISLFPSEVDNYAFLNEMDVLITDYSSVYFDFSLTGKPVILFIYDIDDYLRDRGVYLDIESMPFAKAYSTDELIELLKTKSYLGYDYTDSEYSRTYLAYDSERNSANVLSLLFDSPDPSIPIIDYRDNIHKHWHVIDPERMYAPGDVETVCRAADPNHDIVVLPRGGFTKDMSALLHDNYRDAVNFVFITRTLPRTYVEDVIKRFYKPLQSKLHKREIQRVFPNLSINPNFQDCAYVGEVGTTFTIDNDRVPILDAIIGSDGEKLTIDIGGSNLTARKIAVVKGRRIVWARTLSSDEQSSGCITEDFRDFLAADAGRNKQRLRVGLDVIGDGDDESHFVYLTADHAKTYKDDRTANHYPAIHFDPDDFTDEEIETSVFLHRQKGTVITPYLQVKSKRLTILLTYEDEDLRRYKHAKTFDVHATRKNTIHLWARLRKSPRMSVDGVIMRYRSDLEEIRYDVDYTQHELGEWIFLDVMLDPSLHEYREIYWDILIQVVFDGRVNYIQIRTSAWFRLKELIAAHLEANVNDELIIFPYSTMGNRLAFTVREPFPDDFAKIRAKEIAAFATFAVLHPYWKRKRIWLVFEKFSSLAQDNGFYFFQYCMDQVSPDRNKHIYYVIDKDSPDYTNVKRYGDHVIPFMSFKHMLYAMVASMYVGSDARTHLYMWRPKPSLIVNRIRRHKIFFLQHGVTALKDVSPLFGRRGSNKMTYFLTTSQNEQDVVVERLRYSREESPILGFSRWDVLEDASDKSEPLILMMPTWRPWLEDATTEVFVNSDYFKAYSSLINSPRLVETLERANATVAFFIHPKLAKQIENFSTPDERIKLIPLGSVQLNKIIMRCSMLVTDYSSVCWDVLYMNKPVVFYQFDQETYQTDVGSLVDLNSLPGPVCLDEQHLLDAIDECVEGGFEISEEDAAIADSWFEYRDTNNRKRTYDFLVDSGF